MEQKNSNTAGRKSLLNLTALFVIFLVISIPFYSADVLAVSVHISKNTGQAGIENFIDGQGDTWELQATIVGAAEDSVSPENVKLNINNVKLKFDSCSGSDSEVSCDYSLSLIGIEDSKKFFDILYEHTLESGEQETISLPWEINVDGSPPDIFDIVVEQADKEELVLDFIVNDEVDDAPAVGLKEIKIVDANTGAVLLTLNEEVAEKISFQYSVDGNTNSRLSGVFAGEEGVKVIKVIATDLFDHEQTLSSGSFMVDNVAPVVQDNLNLTNVGKFVGGSALRTGMTIDIIEKNELKVKAHSEEAGLDHEPASCTRDDNDNNLWHCRWESFILNPENSFTVKITAEDAFSNLVEKDFPISLVSDDTPPLLDYYGTGRDYEGKSFLKSGQNRIIARVSEQGAGLSKENIKANLGTLNSGNYQVPEECSYEEGTYNCYWDVHKTFPTGTSTVNIGLTEFKDKVGNEGLVRQVELFVDDSGPVIEELKILGVSELGENNFFKSGDKIKIKFTAAESSGLTILVNLNDLVMDAAATYPESELTRGLGDGWQVFTEGCQREEGKWKCEIETDAVKSGPDNAPLIFKIQDTAGNDAQDTGVWIETPGSMASGTRGEYRFALLGEDGEEATPNYWEIIGTPKFNGFVNLELAKLIQSRVQAEVNLKATLSSGNVQARKVQLVDCAPAAELNVTSVELSRQPLLYGGTSSRSNRISPKIVFEFLPFEAEEVFSAEIESGLIITVPFDCQLIIHSQVGDNIVRNAELQEIRLDIPFGYTDMGGLDKNIAEKIKEERASFFTGAAQVISTINNWIEYIQFLINFIVKPIIVIMKTIDLIMIQLEPAQKASAEVPPVYAMITSSCGASKITQKTISKIVDYIEIPADIVSCRQGGKLDEIGFFSEISKWQKTVLDFYNNWIRFGWGTGDDASTIRPLRIVSDVMYSVAGTVPKEAGSLHDNLIVSGIGLCIPGVVYNLDKIAQIQCRYIYCLENEVPQGVPVDICEKLRAQMTCKYALGEVMGMLPFFKPLDMIFNNVKTAIQDPIGTAASIIWNACALFCPTSTAGSGLCSISTVIIYYGKEILNMIGAFESRKYVQADYCSIIFKDQGFGAEGAEGEEQVDIGKEAAEIFTPPI